MDTQTFLKALEGITIFPAQILTLLRERAEALGPVVREKIIADMKAAEEREKNILEEGGGAISAIERKMKAAKRKTDESSASDVLPTFDQ